MLTVNLTSTAHVSAPSLQSLSHSLLFIPIPICWQCLCCCSGCCRCWLLDWTAVEEQCAGSCSFLNRGEHERKGGNWCWQLGFRRWTLLAGRHGAAWERTSPIQGMSRASLLNGRQGLCSLYLFCAHKSKERSPSPIPLAAAGWRWSSLAHKQTLAALRLSSCTSPHHLPW